MFKKRPPAEPKTDPPGQNGWTEPTPEPIPYWMVNGPRYWYHQAESEAELDSYPYPLYDGWMHNAAKAVPASPLTMITEGYRKLYEASDGSIWELIAGSQWDRLTGPNGIALAEMRWLREPGGVR